MTIDSGSGVAIVDKPSGLSSHAVVAQARRLFGRKDIGHAGTLDPMATGVLLLLIGQACKLSGYLTADSKRYRAELSFGKATDSLDADGRTTLEAPLLPDALARVRVEKALDAERARSLQIPPAVSAIKIDGQRAYALARKGLTPELAEREVKVLDLTLLEIEPPRLHCELLVSKGYYIRAFARDLGDALGVPSHLSGLRRLASGPFTIERAIPWPASEPPALVSLVEAASAVLPQLRLKQDAVLRARQGKRLAPEDFDAFVEGVGPAAWLTPDGELVAIGTATGDLQVLRGFNSELPQPSA